MRTTLILTTALVAAGAASAQEMTLMSWGGAYGQSQEEAYNKPFEAETGIDVTMVDADNPATPIKAMVEAGNVTVDVADVETADAIRLCDEGLLEPLDASMLPAAPDGTPAEEDFVEGAIGDCSVASIVWSQIFAYNTEAFDGEGPTAAADFFDLEAFPGKRGLRKNAKALLEFALMADGVPADEVYDMLETDEGVERAFAMLDTIKDEIVWWEAGAQPPQLLADGEVVMTSAYNGRIFNAAVGEGQPFEIVWDGQIYDFDMFVIPRGAPNMEAALEYIAFATDTQRLADQARWISYGPARQSSSSLVGLYQDGETEMGPQMPTAPENLTNAVVSNVEFWTDRDAELNERFNAWLSQ